ncbi:uroporphyrin-III C-methyltransferase/precorrin-2 dehydrogenase/sirohydrochlorin ferrochelatase [Sphingomonas sp. BE123]|uniref:NAD(P)-dependent oxidoreductase n=1 Tax=Sphingomonas sp. BE123 TaxID=2817842 RepID=UPI00286056FA|nr:NAD(P)-dependent oxidoreductase [Sphingomonas sp. BE123]MDR6852492.1 uroporphyrin-III C-methyltransferase/precorrin-2 dehydrogenase/sirohydrochlorin ferrochelatase [Sphingomonas sp. BE123]
MKRSGLPVFVRLDGRPAILVGDGAMAEAKRRLLERAGAVIVGEDAPAHIALVACADPEPVVARLKARGLLVNVADRPDLCDFTLPAIVERDPVTIAIGTGGASAGLAAALRQRIEPLVPASLGALADALAAARGAMRARWPDGGERRRALGAGLSGPLDPLQAQDGEAVARWIAGSEVPGDRIERIILTSSDPDDLTLRQARWLAQADRVTHRADVPAAILDRARADADRIACDAPPPGLPGLTVDVSTA